MARAPVFWFTGLSGAGKSTVCEIVRTLLEADGFVVATIDGDDVRNRLHRHLSFSVDDIKENNRLIAQLCGAERLTNDAVLVPIISPFRESRAQARAELSPGFHEVYFAASLAAVTERDTKGLYARAARGEIDNMIGVSTAVPYETPIAPELTLQTGSEAESESASRLYRYILQQLRPTR